MRPTSSQNGNTHSKSSALSSMASSHPFPPLPSSYPYHPHPHHHNSIPHHSIYHHFPSPHPSSSVRSHRQTTMAVPYCHLPPVLPIKFQFDPHAPPHKIWPKM